MDMEMVSRGLRVWPHSSCSVFNMFGFKSVFLLFSKFHTLWGKKQSRQKKNTLFVFFTSKQSTHRLALQRFCFKNVPS